VWHKGDVGGTILRHSTNCSTKTNHSSSSFETYSRFNDEDCYHEFYTNWTLIEWSWMTKMRRLTLQGTQKFRVTQRWRRRHNSQTFVQLFRQDRSLTKFIKVATNQCITHYYKLGGTRRNSQALGQLFHKNRSLNTFTWHLLEVYWRGLLPWGCRKLDTDRMNVNDWYEPRKIVGIELISMWDNNIQLWNRTIWSINWMHTLSITLVSLFSYLSLTENKHLDQLTKTL
jgi:hypothetical protein